MRNLLGWLRLGWLEIVVFCIKMTYVHYIEIAENTLTVKL